MTKAEQERKKELAQFIYAAAGKRYNIHDPEKTAALLVKMAETETKTDAECDELIKAIIEYIGLH